MADDSILTLLSAACFVYEKRQQICLGMEIELLFERTKADTHSRLHEVSAAGTCMNVVGTVKRRGGKEQTR
jgi:hypothetical protein